MKEQRRQQRITENERKLFDEQQRQRDKARRKRELIEELGEQGRDHDGEDSGREDEDRVFRRYSSEEGKADGATIPEVVKARLDKISREFQTISSKPRLHLRFAMDVMHVLSDYDKGFSKDMVIGTEFFLVPASRDASLEGRRKFAELILKVIQAVLDSKKIRTIENTEKLAQKPLGQEGFVFRVHLKAEERSAPPHYLCLYQRDRDGQWILTQCQGRELRGDVVTKFRNSDIQSAVVKDDEFTEWILNERDVRESELHDTDKRDQRAFDLHMEGVAKRRNFDEDAELDPFEKDYGNIRGKIDNRLFSEKEAKMLLTVGRKMEICGMYNKFFSQIVAVKNVQDKLEKMVREGTCTLSSLEKQKQAIEWYQERVDLARREDQMKLTEMNVTNKEGEESWIEKK